MLLFLLNLTVFMVKSLISYQYYFQIILYVGYMFQWFNWLSVWAACSTIVIKFGCLALFQNLLKSEI